MTLNEAIALASRQHEGQLDKGGQPYILHPLAVMFKLIEQGITNEAYLITAVLHDVIEDTDITIEEIDKMYTLTREIKEALELLTHKYPKKVEGVDTLDLKISEESYDNYISRLSSNEMATKIKIADLRHNLDLDRMINVKEPRKDFEFNLKRINKYLVALKVLTKLSDLRGYGK